MSPEDPRRCHLPPIDERDLFPRVPPLHSLAEAPYEDEAVQGEEEELELGLSLGGAARPRKDSRRDDGDAGHEWGDRCGRIFTSVDFPATGYKQQQHQTSMRPAEPPEASTSSVSSSSSSHADRYRTGKGSAASAGGGGSVGTKRAADLSASEPRSNSPSPAVVGWPPIRAYRVNTLVNHHKDTSSKQSPSARYSTNTPGQTAEAHACCSTKTAAADVQENHTAAAKEPAKQKRTNAHLVKVNMDGMAIGRKVDLGLHSSYNALALALEDMFHNNPNPCQNSNKTSKLLDGSSDYVLTYEDKDADWMLVGDVPWGMFFNSVRRLRIMRKCDANVLAPGVQHHTEGLRRMHG